MNNSNKQNKPAFTPGPWSIQDNDDEMLFRIMPKGKDYGVALCGDPADAALIAAAPELYEALEFILNNDRLMNALPPNDRDLLRAALAKARGES